MDADFWAARMNSARHLSAVQTNRLTNSDNHSTLDNDGEEDSRAWFPCPFCYVEIEVQMLCNHLQEEHCFDFKNAVCPICAATLGKEPLVHFTLQHAQSVKRRRKYQKSGFWNNTTAISVKDSHELNSLYCTNLMVGRYNGQEPAPDPLLLPFLCNVAHSDAKDGLQDKSCGSAAAASDMERYKLRILEMIIDLVIHLDSAFHHIHRKQIELVLNVKVNISWTLQFLLKDTPFCINCPWNKQRIYVDGVVTPFLNPTSKPTSVETNA